jgi:hypothetical protein
MAVTELHLSHWNVLDTDRQRMPLSAIVRVSAQTGPVCTALLLPRLCNVYLYCHHDLWGGLGALNSPFSGMRVCAWQYDQCSSFGEPLSALLTLRS